MENVDGIVSIVYQYLTMLRTAGPQEWVFNESRDIAAMNFRFKSKSRPIDYTVHVGTCSNFATQVYIMVADDLFWVVVPAIFGAMLLRACARKCSRPWQRRCSSTPRSAR